MPKYKPDHRDRRGEPDYVAGGRTKHHKGGHRHIGELYGDNVLTGLRPWARRRVLEQVGR